MRQWQRRAPSMGPPNHEKSPPLWARSKGRWRIHGTPAHRGGSRSPHHALCLWHFSVLTMGLSAVTLGLSLSTAVDFTTNTQHALHTWWVRNMEELKQNRCFHVGVVLWAWRKLGSRHLETPCLSQFKKSGHRGPAPLWFYHVCHGEEGAQTLRPTVCTISNSS